MGRNTNTSAVVDYLLLSLVASGAISAALIAPGSVRFFDKHLGKYFATLDKRSREREYKRVLYNMKRNGLISYTTNDYEHGLKITKKGLKRAKKAKFDSLAIPRPEKWDKNWHIVFFDIPEAIKSKRDKFSRKLRLLGFVQLQRSVWVHPYTCRDEVGVVAAQYGIEKYVTYIETSYIDASEKLRERFSFL